MYAIIAAITVLTLGEISARTQANGRHCSRYVPYRGGAKACAEGTGKVEDSPCGAVVAFVENRLPNRIGKIDLPAQGRYRRNRSATAADAQS